MGRDGSNTDKLPIYLDLVAKRKECHLCAEIGLTNPSKVLRRKFDDKGHIGPWTQWQGNLDAELMVVGQDWGGIDYYVENKGADEEKNETNQRICELLESVDVRIALPKQPQPTRSLFFTNSVLCLRPRTLTGGYVRSRCFTNCRPFLRSQVELVRPRVVVTLGLKAFRSLVLSFGMRPQSKKSMKEAVLEVIRLTDRTTLVPVFHPGKRGTISRNKEKQKEDWKRVKAALDEARA